MGQLHISLAAEKIGSIWGLPITNSILTTWVVMLILTLFAFFATKSISVVPGTLQSVAEVFIENLHTLFKSVVGESSIAVFFPLLATIFFFIIVSNWIGLLPGVGTIGIREEVKAEETTAEPAVVTENKSETAAAVPENTAHKQEKLVPIFRGATADLNTTLAIALIAMSSIQYFGLKTLGISYLKKFFNFSSPIYFYVGILELISEFSKIISFSFRLFGNIFAGEVLLTVIAFLIPLIAPLPFLGLELFVGFIQALVFAMLTAVFLKMATLSHAEH